LSIQTATEQIIIIDDEREVVTSLVDLLVANGISATGETDSEIFLKRLGEDHFDIIITDFRMPKITGLDIAKKVSELELETDVIIITGYGTMDLAIESLHQNVFDFVLKPFKYDELLHTINKALERRRLIRENSRLTAEREKHIKELNILYEINEIVVKSSDREIVLNFAADTLTVGIGIQTAGIMLTELEQSEYHFAKGIGDFESMYPGLTKPVKNNILNALLKKTGIIELDDISKYFDFSSNENGDGHLERKMWIVPMAVSSSIIGFIMIVPEKNEENLTYDISKLLKVLANQLGPQLRIIEQECRTPSFKQGTLVRLKRRMIESKEKVDKYGGSVSFIFFRTINTQDSEFDGYSLLSSVETLGSLIQEKLSDSDEAMQIGIDGHFMTLYGGSKIETELNADSMSYEFQSILSESILKGLKIKVTTVTYPEDDTDIIKLFHDIVYDYTMTLHHNKLVN